MTEVARHGENNIKITMRSARKRRRKPSCSQASPGAARRGAVALRRRWSLLYRQMLACSVTSSRIM